MSDRNGVDVTERGRDALDGLFDVIRGVVCVPLLRTDALVGLLGFGIDREQLAGMVCVPLLRTDALVGLLELGIDREQLAPVTVEETSPSRSTRKKYLRSPALIIANPSMYSCLLKQKPMTASRYKI